MMNSNKSLIDQLIQHFDLKPLPFEGGIYKETYKARESINVPALPSRYHSTRSFGTAILYLLTDEPQSFSALHRLLTDEVYHFYLGDPVEMLLLLPDGQHTQVILGQNVLSGEQVQFVVPAGAWQGSHLKPGGEYALIGTTMAPGYENEDFELGKRVDLRKAYPAATDLIVRLTREK